MPALRLGVLCAFSITALLGESGCALYDPYVPAASPVGPEYNGQEAYDPNDLRTALTAAEAQRQKYYQDASDHEHLKNGLAIALPLLNAGALFGLSTGRSGRGAFPAAVGFGSAGAITSATLLTSPTREQIYLEGATAVGCAMASASPFVMTPQVYQDLFETRAGDLVTASNALDGGIAAANAAISAFKGQAADPLVVQAQAAVASASLTSARAANAATTLEDERIATNVAGSQLRIADLRIAGLVNSQVQTTTYDLGQLKSQLSATALSPTVSKPAGAAPVATVPAPGAGKAAVKAQGKAQHPTNPALIVVDRAPLTQAIAALNAQRAATEAIIAPLQRFFDHVTQSGEQDCVGAAALMLSVDAPTPFWLRQGKDMYVGVHLPSTSGTPAVVVSGPSQIRAVFETQGQAFQLHLTSATNDALGAYKVVVTTGDGLQRRGVDMQVVAPDAQLPPPVLVAAVALAAPAPHAPAAPAVVPPAAAPIAAPAAAASDWPDGGDWKRVLAYGLKTPGATMDSALTAYGIEHAPGVAVMTGNRPAASFSTVEQQALKSGALGDYELWWASNARIGQLQDALKVPAPPSGNSDLFDSQTRTALANDPRTKSTLGPGGTLTAATITALGLAGKLRP